jgi:hypothetical protein
LQNLAWGRLVLLVQQVKLALFQGLQEQLVLREILVQLALLEPREILVHKASLAMLVRLVLKGYKAYKVNKGYRAYKEK